METPDSLTSVSCGWVWLSKELEMFVSLSLCINVFVAL